MRLIPVLNARERAYGEKHPDTQLGRWATEHDKAVEALELCIQPMDCDPDEFDTQARRPDDLRFMQAERLADGTRTYRVTIWYGWSWRFIGTVNGPRDNDEWHADALGDTDQCVGDFATRQDAGKGLRRAVTL